MRGTHPIARTPHYRTRRTSRLIRYAQFGRAQQQGNLMPLTKGTFITSSHPCLSHTHTYTHRQTKLKNQGRSTTAVAGKKQYGQYLFLSLLSPERWTTTATTTTTITDHNRHHHPSWSFPCLMTLIHTPLQIHTHTARSVSQDANTTKTT